MGFGTPVCFLESFVVRHDGPNGRSVEWSSGHGQGKFGENATVVR